mgnify:CR=1 FL=1
MPSVLAFGAPFVWLLTSSFTFHLPLSSSGLILPFQAILNDLVLPSFPDFLNASDLIASICVWYSILPPKFISGPRLHTHVWKMTKTQMLRINSPHLDDGYYTSNNIKTFPENYSKNKGITAKYLQLHIIYYNISLEEITRMCLQYKSYE